MRSQQARFDFDLFEMAGFSAPTIDDIDAARRARMARERPERMEREFRERQRATKERHERDQREREEQARRNRRARPSSAYESPWSVLGVTPGCSGAEIKSAWRRLCRKHHPDVGGDAAEMQRVNRAYESLKGQMR